MADGGKLIIKIDGDDSGFKKVSNQLGKIGDIGFKAIKAGALVAAGAITAIGTAAIKSYADYEQLVGGVDTLFKENSKQVQEYAAQAYKTAGLSANEYMETVTSFSASLLQSLGGDTKKAAEYANMAVTDMSDNANKMGTSMESLQNAYQGFAKQNYTMLDNLKLGYGGTKEEMARLIKDASKLDKSINKNDMSFGNIVKSINAVQKEMDILGTTSKEASTTISGSLNSMKASWKNLLTGVADPSQDFDKLVQEFVDSVVTFGKNLAPRIKIVLSGAVDLFKALGPELVKAIQELLPMVLGAFGEFLGGILGFVSDNIQPIIATIYTLTTAFMTLKAISVISTTIAAVTTAIGALGVGATGASVAVTALNAVMAANPFGAVAAAIALVVAGLALLIASSKDTQSETAKMIAQSEENIEKLEEERKAYDDLKASKEEEAKSSLAQIAYAQSLYNELTRLADANGNVAEKDRARAEFIVGELNEAYGTEISIVDGVIQKYGELGASIDAIIAKKQAQILLDAYEGVYTEAITKNAEAVKLQNQSYLDITNAVARANGEFEGLNLTVDDVINGLNESNEVNKLWMDTNNATADSILALKEEYKTAGDTVGKTSSDISNYESAMAASIEGDYEKVKQILSGGNDAFQNAADEAGKTTAQIKQQAGQNYADAVAAVAVALDNYTRNQNTTNEQAYNDAISHAADMRSAYTTVGGEIVNGEVEGFNGNTYKINEAIEASVAEVAAYKEQYKGKGEDAGQGYADGLASKIEAVKIAAGNLAKKAIEWLALTQKSSSPAKETTWKGEDFGDGYAIGISKKEGVAKKSAKKLGLAAINSLGKGIDEGKTEVEKVMDGMNKTLLDSEVKYLEESARIEEENKHKALRKKVDDTKKELALEKQKAKEILDEKNAEAKDEKQLLENQSKYEKSIKEANSKYVEKIEKIKQDSINQIAEDEQKAYLNGLKETADKEREIYQAKQRDIEIAQTKIRDTFRQLAEEAFDSIYEIEKAQAKLEGKLKDFGDLYTTEKIKKIGSREEIEVVKLSDIEKQTQSLEDYAQALLDVKARGDVPQEFFDTLRDLSVEEGTKFANALLKADDKTFNKYIEDWKLKQEKADELSKLLYADETENAKAEIKKAFEKFDEDLDKQGEQNAEAWGKGFLDEVKKQIPSILETINSAFGDIIGMPSYALATGNTVQNYTTYNDRGKVVVEGKVELDGREVGRMVVDEGDAERRRRGTK